MPGSLLSGAFKFVDSSGTAIHYEGCFLDRAGCPIPHGPGIRRENHAVSGQWLTCIGRGTRAYKGSCFEFTGIHVYGDTKYMAPIHTDKDSMKVGFPQ